MEGLLLGLGWWGECGAGGVVVGSVHADTGKGSLKLCLT